MGCVYRGEKGREKEREGKGRREKEEGGEREEARDWEVSEEDRLLPFQAHSHQSPAQSLPSSNLALLVGQRGSR